MSKSDVQVTMRPTEGELGKRLKSRIKKIGNLGLVNKQVAVYLDSWVLRNFAQEGAPVGGWAPIKRAGMILQDTGLLKRSFSPFSDSDDAGIGSDVPYARVHQQGLGHVKRRRMLPEHADVDDAIFKIYDYHVEVLTRQPL